MPALTIRVCLFSGDLVRGSWQCAKYFKGRAPMRIRSMQLVLPVVLATAVVATSDANEHSRRSSAVARLSSFNEVPAIVTGARGSFRATLSADGTTLSFELSWEGLSGPPLFAHIHVGQAGVNGGVTIFLCGGDAQPACPQATSASITGTATAANVLAIPAQGVQAGNLAQVLNAMRLGKTYANIHTPQFMGGEARGQISVRSREGEGEGEED